MFKWPLRWMMVGLLMALTFMVSGIIFWTVHPLSGVSVMVLMPAIWLFSFGTFKMRLLNSLPIIALSVVLYIGFTYGRFDMAVWVFMAVPYVGLLLKPRRHPYKYVMMLLSSLIILLDVTGIQDIDILTRLIFTLVIYGVFMPPVLLSKLKNLLRKVKGLH
ncbi:MAG: hypothetical protein ACQEQA_01800 [Bacillota bacterium]